MAQPLHRVVLGLASLALLTAGGCSLGGDGDHRYGYDNRYRDDRVRSAGYGYNRDTYEADRATGMTPRQYYNNTRTLSPDNYGTTHADRVEHHEEHEDHLDKVYGN